MDHKLVVGEIIARLYCAKKDVPDLVTHELRHMGLGDVDMEKCNDEVKKYMKE